MTEEERTKHPFPHDLRFVTDPDLGVIASLHCRKCGAMLDTESSSGVGMIMSEDEL